MELNQLKSFLCVAREKNLTRAARVLHLSQSALSTQIRGLEESLGVVLFERKARGMELTAHGTTLHQQARQVLDAAQALKDAAGRLSATPTGAVTVGLNTDPAFLRMRTLDAQIERHYPKIRIEFIPSQTLATTSLLREGVLDAGFRFGLSGDEGIDEIPLADVPLCVVIPTRFVRNGMTVRDFTWTTLAALPWLWTTCECPFHKLVADRMAEYGVRPRPVADALDEYIVREMVANGKGASVMRRDMGELLEEEGLAVVWDEPDMFRNHSSDAVQPGRSHRQPGPLSVPLSLACLARRRQDPLIQALVERAVAVWSA